MWNLFTNPTVDAEIVKIKAAMTNLSAVIAKEEENLRKAEAAVSSEIDAHSSTLNTLAQDYQTKVTNETNRHSVKKAELDGKVTEAATNVTKGKDFLASISAAINTIDG